MTSYPRDQKPAVRLGVTFSRSGVWLVSHISNVEDYDLAFTCFVPLYLETEYNQHSFLIILGVGNEYRAKKIIHIDDTLEYLFLKTGSKRTINFI